jgi:cell division protein FtsL
VRRSLILALAAALFFILTGLVVVGLRVQQVHLGYQLDALRTERDRLDGLTRQLEVEVATLRSPRRVEARARQLGLTTPGRQQVRQAREFMAGPTGLAAAERNRVASLGVASRSETVGRAPLHQ